MQQVHTPQDYPSKIKIKDLVLGQNPRRGKNPAEATMRLSIREKGVYTPVLTRVLADGRFELRAGFSRVQYAREEIGEDYEIPMKVHELSDVEAEEMSLIENVQRGDMNPAEEAEAAAKILATYNGDRDEAAKRLGLTRPVLDARLALMNNIEVVRDAMIEGKILLGHAELIATLPKEKQEGVLKAILASPKKVLVSELKSQIQKLANALSEAPFSKEECAGCLHNSSNQQALFGEAVDVGYCTNRGCWDAKVDVVLEAKKESLKEDFPEIRIVRAGENFTVIKLVASGAMGVGEDQAQACRSCGKFGAAISAVPGKVGKVVKDLCFDAECNAAKVKLNQEILLSDANEAAPAVENTGSPAGQASSTGAAKKSAKASTGAAVTVQDSTRVKDYRVKIWRKALARHLATNPAQNERVLIALAMSGDARHISSSKVGTVFTSVSKIEAAALDPTMAFEKICEAGDEVVAKMRLVLAASAADSIEEHKLVALLKVLQVNLQDHWKIDEDFFNLLTKSEIEVVADQIGIKAHAGKEYSKLMTGKKDEIIKKLMTVSGFDYSGKIPNNMQFNK